MKSNLRVVFLFLEYLKSDAFNNPVDMDNLTYTYQNGNTNSNRLMRVEDSTSVYDNNGFQNGNSGTDDYAYDANGNMTEDKNKGITNITYNYLNLPQQITFADGNTIEYLYNALGVKLQKELMEGNNIKRVDYLDGFQYVGGMLNFFPTEEGYVRATSITDDPADPQLVFNYVYNYTDHLGNIRLSYTKDPATNELKIMEENNYYPFGLRHKVYGSVLKQDYLKEEEANGNGNEARPGIVIESPYNYKYNGKEFQDELGLNLYDYGFRNYDPALGRWMNMDPLAENYFSYSSYVYVRNNPVLRVDKLGMWDVTVHLYNDRKQQGYGIAIVTDRNGKEVYRFIVRAEGAAGRDRMQRNSDTPLGVYDIPDDNPWITGGSRQSYGPNARLNMSPESGEIVDSGRDQIRIHGGRQEVYNKKTKKWEAVSNPQLKKTFGCLRTYDSDMVTFKQITDNLQANDSEEIPGQVTIIDDLEKRVTPASDDNTVEVEITYQVPAAELEYWQHFVNNLLNMNNNNNENGGQ